MKTALFIITALSLFTLPVSAKGEMYKTADEVTIEWTILDYCINKAGKNKLAAKLPEAQKALLDCANTGLTNRAQSEADASE